MHTIHPASIIEKAIQNSLTPLGAKIGQIHLEHPAIGNYGDYSSNIAMSIFPSLREPPLAARGNLVFSSPRQLAEILIQSLQENKELNQIVAKIEIAGSGFINFHLKSQVLLNELKEINKLKERYGEGSLFKNQKIIIEYTDPNPFKEFHIGHLYSNIVGESLAKLFEFQSANVKRANYQGDVGMHVAKAVWGMIQLKDQMPNKNSSLDQQAKFMGQAYALGANKFEENEKIITEITEINKKIYSQDPSLIQLYQTGRKWSLDYFETIYQRLGTKFDFYFFESEVGKIGYEFVKQNLEKGVFKRSQGAIIFPGNKFGLHDRVFINSLDLPTYEAKDLGLAPSKYQKFPYDLSVIVTGNEIKEYFKVVLMALQKINPELRKKTKHISHGMVKLPTGKMSSRTGKVITGEWLLDEAAQKAQQVSEEKNPEDINRSVSEQIGIGAIKYSLLKSGIGNDVIFNFDESVNFNGNSGPYLQYTYARARSVLSKVSGDFSTMKQCSNLTINNEELATLRWIYRFPEVVAEAAENYAPNLICNFLFELAQRFNTFYNKHQILPKVSIGGSHPSIKSDFQSQFRLLLTSATSQVLENGLRLLGIAAPSKM